MMTFATKKDAIEFMDDNFESTSDTSVYGWFKGGRYDLSYGEYERPSFFVRRYKDGWGIHRETFYYSNVCCAVKSGRFDPADYQ